MAQSEIVLRIALPRWSRRRWAGVTVLLVSAFAVAVRAVPMWPYVPPTYAVNDKLSSAKLTAQFQQVSDNLNDLKNQIVALQTTPVCPTGYAQNGTVGTMNTPLCMNGNDEIVKVGTGRSAFFIDRYLASVWSDAGAKGTQYAAIGVGGQAALPDYPASFPKNGQWTAGNQLYAVSKVGVQPSGNITWYQAEEACHAVGKRLPLRHEWYAAAVGTYDPPIADNGAANGECVTNAAGPRASGGANVMSQTHCVSNWGVQDMVGNMWEWTDEWYMGLSGQVTAATWADPIYNGDAIWGADGVANDGKNTVAGLPAAASRAGSWSNGTQAGQFSVLLFDSPAYWDGTHGFRCVMP